MIFGHTGKRTDLLMQIRVPQLHFRLVVSLTYGIFKDSIMIDRHNHAVGMALRRLLFASLGLAIVFLYTSYGSELPKQTKKNSASRAEQKPVHIVVRSAAEIKQTFSYSPFPAIPTELEGYGGSQVGGTGSYRLTVDAQGSVTQVTILKGFTVAAVYDERFSNAKGNAVPALDKVMVQSLMRWRAKPGPMRVVDIYWSFGTRPWVNYGKSNGSQ